MDPRRTSRFEKAFKKLNTETQIKIYKQVNKIEANPLIGKRFERKGTRELYIKPHRLSYLLEDEQITLLDIYHKDEQ